MAPSTLRERMSRWLLLRLTGLLLSISALLMLVSLTPQIESNEEYYADLFESIFMALPFAGNCWTIIYNSIILGIGLAGISYHPGIDIALDFIGWGLNWSMGILLVAWAGEYDYTQYACDKSYDYDAVKCEFAKKVMGIQWTGGLLTIIVGAFHLAHFVQACIDTHHIVISEKRAKFMELGAVNRV